MYISLSYFNSHTCTPIIEYVTGFYGTELVLVGSKQKNVTLEKASIKCKVTSKRREISTKLWVVHCNDTAKPGVVIEGSRIVLRDETSVSDVCEPRAGV